jgi:hypothetical protein
METRPRRAEGDAGPRSSERPVRAPGALPRRDKVDPWFLKPYEPAVQRAAAPAGLGTSSSSSKPPRQKLAALLGGMPKS